MLTRTHFDRCTIQESEAREQAIAARQFSKLPFCQKPDLQSGIQLGQLPFTADLTVENRLRNLNGVASQCTAYQLEVDGQWNCEYQNNVCLNRQLEPIETRGVRSQRDEQLNGALHNKFANRHFYRVPVPIKSIGEHPINMSSNTVLLAKDELVAQSKALRQRYWGAQ